MVFRCAALPAVIHTEGVGIFQALRTWWAFRARAQQPHAEVRRRIQMALGKLGQHIDEDVEVRHVVEHVTLGDKRRLDEDQLWIRDGSKETDACQAASGRGRGGGGVLRKFAKPLTFPPRSW